jgi:hypothetical protein
MTGILDHPVLAMKSDGDLWFNNGARVPLSEILEELKNEAIATNKDVGEEARHQTVGSDHLC